MVKGVSKKENTLLFISNHKVLCGICACIELARIKMGFNKGLHNQIEQTLDVFLKKDENSMGGYPRVIVWDMLYSRYRNMIESKEYFLYNFRSRSDYGRKDFVGVPRLFLFWKKLWDEDTCKIYDNKYLTYQTYRKYYGREVICISSDSDFVEFFSFVQRHDQFIVKPLNDYGGKGIHIEQVNRREEAQKVFNELRVAGAVVEELVIQSPEMAKYNPSSVNTVRFVTFYHRNKLTKICAVLRMGRNGSEVDNATYGGIFVPIDMDHGIAYTYAESYRGEKYAIHPDTGVQIIGTKIPKWAELNRLMEELVKVVPQQKMIGWDMALIPSGWVIIEANHNPACQDQVHDHGLREVMHDFYEAFYE